MEMDFDHVEDDDQNHSEDEALLQEAVWGFLSYKTGNGGGG